MLNVMAVTRIVGAEGAHPAMTAAADTMARAAHAALRLPTHALRI
jgi:hypothetical protein